MPWIPYWGNWLPDNPNHNNLLGSLYECKGFSCCGLIFCDHDYLTSFPIFFSYCTLEYLWPHVITFEFWLCQSVHQAYPCFSRKNCMYNMNKDAAALMILLGYNSVLQIDNAWLARGFDSYTIVFLVDKSAYGGGPTVLAEKWTSVAILRNGNEDATELIFIDNQQSNMLYTTILEKVSLLHTQYWNTWYFTLLSLKSL